MPGVMHALVVGINRYLRFDDADLRGAVNDAERMAALLTARFGLANDRLTTLHNEEATRSGILEAMDRIAETIEPGDLVVFFYSGHGSRLRDPRVESTTAPMIESIVPHDSGRGDDPNRDILDEEIDRWIQRVNQKTDHVTLILDSCHSGSATRDGFSERVRQIQADERTAETMFAPGERPAILDQMRSSPTTRNDDAPLWVAGRRRAVTVAACRKTEKASEVKRIGSEAILRYGALSDHLFKVLASTDGGTWRDVFEQVTPAVSSEINGQHPQFEGSLDQVVFGVKIQPPSPHVLVTEADGDSVRIAAGAAHGVEIGSRWNVRHRTLPQSPGGDQAEDSASSRGPQSSEIEIVDVFPTTSIGRVRSDHGGIQPGFRATPMATSNRQNKVSLAIELPSERANDEETVRTALDSSAFLQSVDDLDRAEILLRLLAPRSSIGAETPCPGLGPLDEWTWAAVGADGCLIVQRRSEQEGLKPLILDLEQFARTRNLLDLAPKALATSLQDNISVEILLSKAGQGPLLPSDADPALGATSLRPGDRCDLVVHNRSSHSVWVSLLEFGLDGRIALLMPRPGHSTFRLGSEDGENSGGIRLDANSSLSLREYYAIDPAFAETVEQGLPMSLPDGFPWSTELGHSSPYGLLKIKAFITRKPASFEFLQNGAIRSTGSHPLVQAALRASRPETVDNGERDEIEESEIDRPEAAPAFRSSDSDLTVQDGPATAGETSESVDWIAPVINLALYSAPLNQFR